MPGPPESIRRLDAQIVALLRARGPLTGGQVADALGVQAFGVHLALERLDKAGRVLRRGRTGEKRGGWGGTSWATVWSVPQEPDAAPPTA